MNTRRSFFGMLAAAAATLAGFKPAAGGAKFPSSSTKFVPCPTKPENVISFRPVSTGTIEPCSPSDPSCIGIVRAQEGTDCEVLLNLRTIRV